VGQDIRRLFRGHRRGDWRVSRQRIIKIKNIFPLLIPHWGNS
jgi:hypothetical protein